MHKVEKRNGYELRTEVISNDDDEYELLSAYTTLGN